MPLFAFFLRLYRCTLNSTISTFRCFTCPALFLFSGFSNFWVSGMCAIHHLKYLHIISLFGGAITCSNQNSGVGRIDSFQFFYFILEAVVVQLLPQDKFQEWKCWTKCSTHWNFWSILPTCHLERFYDFTFLSTVFAYLYSQMCFKSNLKKICVLYILNIFIWFCFKKEIYLFLKFIF